MIGFWGRGLRAAGPLTILPQAPSPNPLWGFYWVGEGEANGPAFPGPLCGLGGGWGEGREHLRKVPWPSPRLFYFTRRTRSLRLRTFTTSTVSPATTGSSLTACQYSPWTKTWPPWGVKGV